MNKEQKSILALVRSLTDELLFYSDRFIAVGKEDFHDLLITGRLKVTEPKPLFLANGTPQTRSSRRGKELYARTIDLLDEGVIGAFNLTSQSKQRIDAAIDQLGATHLRLYSSRDGIHIVLFDVRRFEPEYRLKRKYEVLAVTDTISSQASYKFSTAILARSFRRVPAAAYTATVSPNGIVQFRNAAQIAYALPDDARDVLFISWQTPGPTKEWLPVNRWRIDRMANVAAFDTTKTVNIYDKIMPGRTVQVYYSTIPNDLSNNTDDFATVTGLPETSRDVITLGAAYRLLSYLDTGRINLSSAEADINDNKLPSTAGASASKYIFALYQQRLMEESNKLQDRFPIRVHYSR